MYNGKMAHFWHCQNCIHTSITKNFLLDFITEFHACTFAERSSLINTCKGKVWCIVFANNIGDIRVQKCLTKSVADDFCQNIKLLRVSMHVTRRFKTTI